MRQKLLSLSLFLSASSCVTIPDAEVCAPAGKLTRGAICATTLSQKTRDMTLEEFIEWLESSDVEGDAGAVCQTVADWSALKTALEQACRMLGSRCSKQAVEILEKFKLEEALQLK